MKLNKAAIISAVNKSVEFAKAKNHALEAKAAKLVEESFSIQNFKDFLIGCDIDRSPKMTLEEARVASVKNINPTTYDRYDPIYGLHAE